MWYGLPLAPFPHGAGFPLAVSVVAELLPPSLDFINDSMTKVNKNETAYIHCAGGYRSMIFISILKARGFNNLTDVKGGFKAIKESNQFRITDYVCPSTML